MKQTNLLIDIKSFTEMYKSQNNILGEALSGSTYSQIFQGKHDIHTGERPFLVVPICMWGDATQIDTGSRFKLEP